MNISETQVNFNQDITISDSSSPSNLWRTITDSGTTPTILIGHTKVGATAHVQFRGEIIPADDSGTTPIIRIDVRQDDNTVITTRPLLEITNNSNKEFEITVDGDVQLQQNAIDFNTDGHSITPSATALTFDLGGATDDYIYQTAATTKARISGTGSLFQLEKTTADADVPTYG